MNPYDTFPYKVPPGENVPYECLRQFAALLYLPEECFVYDPEDTHENLSKLKQNFDIIGRKVFIRTPDMECNHITDYYAEDLKVRTRGISRDPWPKSVVLEKSCALLPIERNASIHSTWMEHGPAIRKEAEKRGLKGTEITTFCRQFIYSIHPHIKFAMPSVMIQVIRLLRDLCNMEIVSILDPSAGWGERLIAALAVGGIERYVGVDPDNEMRARYDRIFRTFQSESGAIGYRVVSSPFETVDLKYITSVARDHEFDLVFASLPPFTAEYRVAATRPQPTSQYEAYLDWYNHFFVESIARASKCLRHRGPVIVDVAEMCQFIAIDSLVKDVVSRARDTYATLVRHCGVIYYGSSSSDPSSLLCFEVDMLDDPDMLDDVAAKSPFIHGSS